MLITPNPVNAKHADPIPAELRQLAESVIHRYAAPEVQSDSEKANFADTPVRAIKAWSELLAEVTGDSTGDTSIGIGPVELQTLQEFATSLASCVLPKDLILRELANILQTGFPMEVNEDPGIVTQGPIATTSLCPHHLLPINYEVYVAYKPLKGGTVLGLSKLARVASILSARPVLQEQYSADIADALFFSVGVNNREGLPQIASDGAAVQVIGSHGCMTCRGVRSEALTLTTALRGAFYRDSVKSEFYQAVESIRNSQVSPANVFDEEDEEAVDSGADADDTQGDFDD